MKRSLGLRTGSESVCPHHFVNNWSLIHFQFLEEMPAIEVFVGLDAIRASAEVVPGLPSRADLDEWLAKHDSVDKETEIFDTVELEKLRQLTKGEPLHTICCLALTSP